MLKKMLALLLVCGLMITSFAACGGNNNSSGSLSTTSGQSEENTDSSTGGESVDTGDMYTVQAYFPTMMDVTDVQMVEDEINKLMAERYNAQIHINFINTGSYSQQQNLLLTSDEADIMMFAGGTSPYVSNRQLLALDEYLENASDEFKNKFTEKQWSSCKTDGVLYAVPNLRNYFNRYVCWFDAAKIEEMGVDLSTVKTMEDVGEILYQAHEKYPDIYTLVPQSSSTFVSSGWSWDGCGNMTFLGVTGNFGQDTTVMDIFELPDFVDFCNTVHKWYEDGLCMGDALSNQEVGENMIRAGSAFACFSNRANEPTPDGLAEVTLVDYWMQGGNMNNFVYGINALTSHPQEAFNVFEALYIDTEIQKLLINGIEGVHYVDNGDGTCSYPEGVTAQTSTYGEGTQYWSLPYANVGVLVNTNLGGATFFEDIIELNNTCLMSKTVGFNLDIEALGLVDEYAACSAVLDKYYDGLTNGVLDPETTLPQAHQEMVDNGIEKIIEAKQAALDELLGQ